MKFTAFIAMLLTSISASAATEVSSIWANGGFLSYHLSRNGECEELGIGRHYNEVNYGFGVEMSLTNGDSVSIGEYHNSIYKVSSYATYNWRPLKWGKVSAGLSIGVIDGYSSYYNGGFGPAVFPQLSIETEHIGVNLVYVPPIGGIDSVLAVQFKIRR